MPALLTPLSFCPSTPQFDTIVHAHALLHAQHTTMLNSDPTPGQTNFCRVAVNDASGVHGDTNIAACKADIAAGGDDYVGEYPAGSGISLRFR